MPIWRGGSGESDMQIDAILITGANGFVGRHLILHLLASGAPCQSRVAAAVLPNELESASEWARSEVPRENLGSLAWYAVDITVSGQAADIIHDIQPDAIVHLAARASGADSDRDAVFQVNVEGSRMLIEAAAGIPKEPRTLLISTGYCYGPTLVTRPAIETDPLTTPGSYGAYTDSKIAMEELALTYPRTIHLHNTHSHNTIIARSFSHTGPGQAPVFAIPSFARQLARIELGIDPPQISVGNLDALRDMLDVRDVVKAYKQILYKGEAGEVYNVSTGRPHRMRDLLDNMMGQVAVKIEVVEDPTRLRPADIACSTGNSTKLREATGWEPEIPIDRTLTDTLDYWRTLNIASDSNSTEPPI
jgi:GDP-4-dehydro-6-deoxy-D-mannose reductase